MKSATNLPQPCCPVATAPRNRSVFWSAIVAAAWLLASLPAAAQDVYVLTAGAQPQLETIAVDLSAQGNDQLGSAVAQPLRLADGSVASYTDLVVLPGGHLMLADGSGRGAVRFDEQGDQVHQLFAAGSFAAPPSVVAAGFVFPNVPDLLLIPHHSTGNLRIYDVVADHYVWSHSTIIEDLRPTVARAVVLPQGRVAAAFRWPTLALSVIEIISVDAGEEPDLIVATSRDHPEVADAPQIPDLHPVRDLMGSLEGRLLVTSQTSLHILETSGQVVWSFDLGDDPALGGEFQTARWLDSGHVIAATREPGRWNEPHTNHRVHLFDPEADEPRLASSASFDAAPLRLEAATGHGGTGSLDYFSDSDDDGHASPDQLTVEYGPVITPEAIFPNEQAELDFGAHNGGDRAISLRRAELRAAPSLCEDASLPNDGHLRWWSDLTATQIEPGDDWIIDGHPIAGADLHPGRWCAYLTMMGRDGAITLLGQPQDVELRPPAGRDGPVSVEDLADFQESDAGLPNDAGDPNGAGPNDVDPSGCSCGSTPGSPTSLPVLLLLVFGACAVRSRGPQKSRR